MFNCFYIKYITTDFIKNNYVYLNLNILKVNYIILYIKYSR